ncbi:hypothetical protein Tco_0836016 [Tanacetum coccineum]
MRGSYFSFPCSILSTGKDCKTPQRYLDVPTISRIISLRSIDSFQGLTPKFPHHGIDLWLQVQIFYDHVTPATRRTIDQSAGGKLRDRNAKESWELLEDLALYDNETHLAPMKPTQVNKITSSCEICSGPHDTQYCMENPKQAFVEYASSHTDKVGGLVSNFMASKDARLSKFEADFKQQQSEMTNKIDTVLKSITERIMRALPSDTVKNPKLNVNTTTLVFDSRNSKAKEEERKREGNPEDTDNIVHNEEQKDTPQLKLKDTTVVDNLGSNRDDEGIKWLDVEEYLDLVDISKELVYESMIKEMPKCSLNYDFRIKRGDLRNLKIPCMIGHKFTANTYIDIDLPMNIMSLAYYNSIRKNGYEYRGRNFIGLRRDMHVFVGNISYIMDFTILENIETNIDPSLSHVIFGRPFVEIACLAIHRKHGLMTFTDRTKEITIKTPYKDSERSELSSEGHD